MHIIAAIQERAMNKFIPVLICYISLVAFILIDVGAANDTKTVVHRNRRYLSFPNVSHFYLKFNFKTNIIPWNQLFAQAVGFRMNWDEPPNIFRPYRRLHRRDIYDYVEKLLNRNGLDGFSCLRRAICEMQIIIPERHIVYQKLLKMFFRRISSATDRWHNTTSEECDTSVSACPFSLLQVSPYTDMA